MCPLPGSVLVEAEARRCAGSEPSLRPHDDDIMSARSDSVSGLVQSGIAPHLAILHRARATHRDSVVGRQWCVIFSRTGGYCLARWAQARVTFEGIAPARLEVGTVIARELIESVSRRVRPYS